MGLYFDGRVYAWGNDDNGQLDIPEPNEDFIAIAAGSDHSMGLKSDGTIVAWGANAGGQCLVPAPNHEYFSLAGGWRFSLGLQRLTSPPVAAPAVLETPSSSRITILRVAPNPFNPLTEIRFVNRDAATLTLNIYDVRGARIGTVSLGSLDAGEHHVRWDGRDKNGQNVSSGVYFLQVSSATERSAPVKATLVR